MPYIQKMQEEIQPTIKINSARLRAQDRNNVFLIAAFARFTRSMSDT